MAKKKSTKSKQSDSKVFAFLTVFLSIIGFLIAIIAKRDDKYVMFYAKESLVLFITAIILNVAGTTLTLLTLGIFGIFMPIIGLFLFILWVIQIIYSLSGKKQSTPIIGQFAKKFNL